MKLLYIILDGLGDRPLSALGNKTPLEAAYKPFTDSLSAKSRLGLWQVKKSLAPESDTATMALFGYDPFKYYTGRGPLEASGAGIKLKKNAIAIRCNFAYKEKGRLQNVEADITDDEGGFLARAIDKNIKEIRGVKVLFRHVKGYRAVLILEGEGLSPRISNTHPSYKIIKEFVSQALPRRENIPVRKCLPLVKDRKATKTAGVVNEFLTRADEILESQTLSKKANTILTRGAGSKLPVLPKLRGRWAALTEMPAERALVRLMGMASMQYTRDFRKLAWRALKALQSARAVYIHIKDTDSAAHKGDFNAKTKVIEDFDSKFMSQIIQKANLDKTAICITGDHSTPCELKSHSADPVPVMLYVPGEESDFLRFGERQAAKGSLGKLEGTELFELLQSFLL